MNQLMHLNRRKEIGRSKDPLMSCRLSRAGLHLYPSAMKKQSSPRGRTKSNYEAHSWNTKNKRL